MLVFTQNLSFNLFSAEARGHWWDTGTRAEPSPVSKQCFFPTYGHFSVVSWPCLWSFLPVLVLSEKQNHTHKDGFILQGYFCSGSLECLEMSAEGHPQLRSWADSSNSRAQDYQNYLSLSIPASNPHCANENRIGCFHADLTLETASSAPTEMIAFSAACLTVPHATSSG